jgi:hypothetical protein
MTDDLDEADVPEQLDLPTNLHRCDPERGGCTTLFPPDLEACPHCQMPVGEVDPSTNEPPVKARRKSTQDVQLPEDDKNEPTDK